MEVRTGKIWYNAAWAIVLFALVVGLKTAGRPAAGWVTSYVEYALTTDWEWQELAEQAKDLAGRWQGPGQREALGQGSELSLWRKLVGGVTGSPASP